MANLKQLIGDELFKQLSAEKQKEFEKKDLEDISGGAFIPKARFDQVNDQAKEYKKQVSERDTQISNLKEEYKDVDGLKSKVSKLEEDNKKQKDDYEAKLNNITFNNVLDKALGEYKVKNSKLVKALLDNEKLKVDGNDVIGLKEQMEAIQKDNDFLFEKAAPGGAPDFIIGGKNDPNGEPPKGIGESLGKKAASQNVNKTVDDFFK